MISIRQMIGTIKFKYIDEASLQNYSDGQKRSHTFQAIAHNIDMDIQLVTEW
jgi:hypothetical protein